MVFILSISKWIKREEGSKQKSLIFKLASPAYLEIGSSAPIRDGGAVEYRPVDLKEATQLFSGRSGVRQSAEHNFNPELDNGLSQLLSRRFFTCKLDSKVISSATLQKVSQYLKISTLAVILLTPEAFV